MIRFSPANTKIKELANVDGIRPYLVNRRVYSFDLLSGHTCPFAENCLSKVVETDGKRRIKDGPYTEFRCFSASQEVVYPSVYNLRNANFTALRRKSQAEIEELITAHMPPDLGVCRIHVGGDFFNPIYFRAWVNVAAKNEDKLFYAYTKSLPYWVDNPPYSDNFVLTASWGGRMDKLINKHNLRSARVVYHPDVAKNWGLEIDHDDSHAADPTKRGKDFALLIHGVMPKGSEAAQAIQRLKKEDIKFSYSR